MHKFKLSKRKIHRKVAAISSIPLLITLLSGTIYSFLQPLGVDAFIEELRIEYPELNIILPR